MESITQLIASPEMAGFMGYFKMAMMAFGVVILLRIIRWLF